MTAKADTKSFVDNGLDSVNWNLVHANVQRLQARIVKAWQDKKYKTVKHLQKHLRRSIQRHPRVKTKRIKFQTFRKSVLGIP